MVPVPTMAMRCTDSCENICCSFDFGWSLASAPDGCTFFGEGQRTFVRVFGVQQAVRIFGLAQERVGVIEALCFAQNLLDLRQCKRCVTCDARGKLLRGCQCGPSCGQLADEPVLLGVDRRNRLAG